MKKILVDGIQPTGNAHLGNYFGMMQNCVRLQHDYQAIYFIVDYHALTMGIDPEQLRTNTLEIASDMLAVGIDPKKSILFRQSDVPEHAELAWIFNCITPIAELERMTQYKDKSAYQKNNVNAGLLTYPVLQAADIMLYHGQYVPVGIDQLQHLELARVIGRKFNNRYGDYFSDIKPVLSDLPKVMSLNDPAKKMSKSLGPKSYISLREKPGDVRSKIAKAVTDTLSGEGTLTGGHNLLMLYKNFAPQDAFEKFEREYNLKTLKYADLKKDLAERIIAFLKPIQEKQKYFDAHPKEVNKILENGAKRARVIATETIKEVRNRVGLPT